MKTTKPKVPGAAAAGVLAVLTLSVFYVLQDYGPVSAIRRFYAAWAANDLSAEQQVLDASVNSDPYLEDIEKYLPRSIAPQIARLDRQQASVRVAVVYPLPSGDKFAIIWIVEKRGALWKINTRLTDQALRASLMQ